MAVFAVQYSYGPAEIQAEHRPAHREYLAQLHEQGTLYVSGPFTSGDTAGALLIFEAETREAIDSIVAADPMYSGGAVTSYTAREWNPVIGKLGK